MRKLLMLLFIPSVSFGANVTAQQVQQAKTGSAAIIKCGVEIQKFAIGVEALMNAGFAIPIVGSTQTVTLSNALKDQVIDTGIYNIKKQTCVDAFNSLP